jgi:hypothetical protein
MLKKAERLTNETHVLLEVVTADTKARGRGASTLSVPCTPVRELQKDDGQGRSRRKRRKSECEASEISSKTPRWSKAPSVGRIATHILPTHVESSRIATHVESSTRRKGLKFTVISSDDFARLGSSKTSEQYSRSQMCVSD